MSDSPSGTLRFIVATAPAPDIAALVLATGAVGPMDMLAEVEARLRELKVAGSVVFDLLLAHGNTANRFACGPFVEGSFGCARWTSAKPRYAELAALSAPVLRRHHSGVDLALLSPAQRCAVRKGIPF